MLLFLADRDIVYGGVIQKSKGQRLRLLGVGTKM